MDEAISLISGNHVRILKAGKRKVTLRNTSGNVWKVTRSYFCFVYVHSLWA